MQVAFAEELQIRRPGRVLDLAGQRFGKLVALRMTPPDARGKRLWVCLCDCGNTVQVNTGTLTTGARQGCSCRLRKHGYSGTATYYAFQGMHQRCSNPKKDSYPDYGGRGIKVCARWGKFENFLADMGERPEGRTLDRLDSNGDYEPGNCRWATDIEQGNNKRTSRIIAAFGERKTLKEWSRDARSAGLTDVGIRKRLEAGLAPEDAISTPPFGMRRSRA